MTKVPETNTTLYIVGKRNGEIIPFISTDLVSARKLATHLAGVYRYISPVPPNHPQYVHYKNTLGL